MRDKDKIKQSLKLDNPLWNYAAKLSCLSTEDWAINALDEAAEEAVLEVERSSDGDGCEDQRLSDKSKLPTCMLDAISFKNLELRGNPYSFQFVAMRHWAGLTQNEAAEAIGISASSYRSCESSVDGITMDSSVWRAYIANTLELMQGHDYDTLPNSFGRALKGLVGMSYIELDQKSNLSQSYWTTRLRFKKDPVPLELASIKEMLRLAIKGIDKKFKEGLQTEARFMLSSLLFFAYQTQRIRVDKNPSLISVMHTFPLPKDEHSSFVKLTSGHKKITPVNKSNLYHLTVTALANKGYIFSQNFPDAQFVHCE